MVESLSIVWVLAGHHLWLVVAHASRISQKRSIDAPLSQEAHSSSALRLTHLALRVGVLRSQKLSVLRSLTISVEIVYARESHLSEGALSLARKVLLRSLEDVGILAGSHLLLFLSQIVVKLIFIASYCTRRSWILWKRRFYSL